MAATRHHLITGSDDSNLHVWPLARLLRLDLSSDPQPDRILSHHRAAITCVVASESSNPHVSLCMSTSRDKTCIVWNYSTGDALRTILFPTAPLCVAIDPFPRLLVVSAEDGHLYALDMFGDKPMVGHRAPESWSTLMKAPAPIAQAPVDQGPASCLALSHDGNTLLSGHPKGQIIKWSLRGHSTQLANLNAAITNLVFLPPLPEHTAIQTVNVVKPSPSTHYSPRIRFEQYIESHDEAARFWSMVKTTGLPSRMLWDAVAAVDLGLLGVDAATESEDTELSRTLNQLGNFARLSAS